MEMKLRSTTKLVEVVVDGVAVPARIWEGETSSGVPVHAYVTRVAVHRDHDASELERDLQEHDAPSPDVQAIPLRLIL